MRFLLLSYVLGLPILLAGCDDQNKKAMSPDDARIVRTAANESYTGVSSSLNFKANTSEATALQLPPTGGKPSAPQVDGADGNPPAVERKLIQTGRLEVAVEDYEASLQKANAIIEEAKAIIASSEFTGNPGQARKGTWLLRVEPAKFAGVVSQLAQLGKVVQHKTDSQDVTEEFFDLTARIKNLKAEEETLNRLLKENARTTQDVLDFRKNILKLRGDIEQAEGRLNVLGRLTSLATIYFTLKEEKAYEPAKKAQDPHPPTYTEQMGKAFDRAWKNLGEFATYFSVFAVEALVWSPVWIPGCIAVWLALRWIIRKIQAKFVRGE